MADLLGFRCAADALEWLTEHRDEPFAWTYANNRMIGGFRSDDGEIHAFDCDVIEYRSELTRQKRTKGKGVAALKGLRGAPPPPAPAPQGEERIEIDMLTYFPIPSRKRRRSASGGGEPVTCSEPGCQRRCVPPHTLCVMHRPSRPRDPEAEARWHAKKRARREGDKP